MNTICFDDYSIKFTDTQCILYHGDKALVKAKNLDGIRNFLKEKIQVHTEYVEQHWDIVKEHKDALIRMAYINIRSCSNCIHISPCSRCHAPRSIAYTPLVYPSVSNVDATHCEFWEEKK